MNDEESYGFSTHTIFGKIRDSTDYYLLNFLTGGAVIVPEETALSFKKNRYQHRRNELIEKGFILNEEDEKILFINAYLNFTEKQENSRINLFFIPWYTCNLACSYCHFHKGGMKEEIVHQDVIDAFFHQLDTTHRQREKSIIISGGEPFLLGDKYETIIENIVRASTRRGVRLSFSTNGFTLYEYIDKLKPENTGELHVMLDGMKSIHDTCRPTIDGRPSFEKVVMGIEKALSRGFSVCLNIVCDRESLQNLHELAAFAEKRGWTENELFRTKIGEKCSFFQCKVQDEKTFTDERFYNALYTMVLDYPEILELYKPFKTVALSLFQKQELPEPVFDFCPALKSEWTFEYTGRIYICPRAAVENRISVGTFFPAFKLEEKIIEALKERDITTIQQCSKCALQLICGGGCPLNAENTKGSLTEPDCRPVKTLIELGLSLYFKKK
jgi:uncharacterized protein